MFDLGKTFLTGAERYPDALAVVHGTERLTYAQWLDMVLCVAGGLEALGLRKGDTVVTALANTLPAATITWAAQLSGLFLVPVNWRMTRDEIGYAFSDANAKVAIACALSRDAVRGAARADMTVVDTETSATPTDDACLDYRTLLTAEPLRTYPNASEDDYYVMLYTSGTTGRPKGVPRRHKAGRAAILAHIEQAGYRDGERAIGVMPLYHTIGIHTLLSLPLVGGAIVLQDRWLPDKTVDLIERERVTSLYLVPTLFHDLLAAPTFEEERVRSVRGLSFAGSTMSEGLARRLTKAFEPERFLNHYGSSEIFTFSIEREFDSNPTSSGKPNRNSRLRIVAMGERDPHKTVEVGEEGEIVADLDGDEAFEGYWNRPDANEKSLVDGWYFTGDTGFVDAAGNLHVTGRVDDVILSGGENISPGEIENVLSLHPAVDAVVAIGHPHEKWGEIVAAYVKRRGAVSEEELDTHCKQSELANFKRPRVYVFVNGFPATATGKILRRKLRDVAASATDSPSA